MGTVRELTAEERRTAEWLEGLAARRGNSRGGGEAIRAKAVEAPERICSAALAVLEGAQTAEEARQWLYGQLVECREFLLELVRPDRMSRQELAELCRKWMTTDGQLDVRLARLTPGRGASGDSLPTETVVRILDVLDDTSQGPRLILLLNHLTRHEDRRIASKAALLVGRRLRSRDWVSRQLESADARLRANVVEGLWGESSPSVQSQLWASLKDKNNRVVGNALIGLHHLGEPAVKEFVKRMIEDLRPPFRWTAAWVMGKIGSPEFIEDLERALQDKEPHVRSAAEQALHAIRECTPKPVAEPRAETPPEPTPEKPVEKRYEEPAEEEQPEVVVALQFDGKKITPLYRPPAGQEGAG